MENLKTIGTIVSGFISGMNQWEKFFDKFSEKKNDLSWDEKAAYIKKGQKKF